MVSFLGSCTIQAGDFVLLLWLPYQLKQSMFSESWVPFMRFSLWVSSVTYWAKLNKRDLSQVI